VLDVSIETNTKATRTAIIRGKFSSHELKILKKILMIRKWYQE
jgi:hypothetical protein